MTGGAKDTSQMIYLFRGVERAAIFKSISPRV
jgi:hypothetical protein